MPRDADTDADPGGRRRCDNACGTQIGIDETRLRQATDIDERAPRQADVRRDWQWVMQFGRLGPDQATAERVAGHDVVGAGAADLEPAQIVTTEKEPVDDLLLDAFIPEVTKASSQRDAPVTVAGKSVERNEVLGVDVGSDELSIAAKPRDIIA